jgi:hypothetical protein
MGRSRQLTSTDYIQQIATNIDELDKRERIDVNDVVIHGYLRQILKQYEIIGLQSDTLLFATLTALGAISRRAFIRRIDNMPVLLNHGSLIVGRTGIEKQ